MANDFSGDSRCKALWKFESGALTTDSKGGNTLTNNDGVIENTTEQQEGSCCAEFTGLSTRYLSIANASLDAGFPLKDGDSVKKGTWCFWVKPHSIATSFLAGLWETTKLSLGLHIVENKFRLSWGYGTGDSEQTFLTHTLTANRVYHVGLSFDGGVTRSVKLRVWDVTAGTATNYSYSPVGVMNVEDSWLRFGNDSGVYFDGIIDEFVVFNDILTDDEIDEIRSGTFDEGVTTTTTTTTTTSTTTSTTTTTTTGPPVTWDGYGEGAAFTKGETMPSKISTTVGLGEARSYSEVFTELSKMVYGESLVQAKADSYLRKTIDVELLSDPNLLVRFKPFTGGGGVLTYKVGTPDIATFWDIVGIGADGYEEPSHGSLRWHYIKSDMSGLAANIYVSPKDPVMAGHRDRITVRKADA